MRRSGEGRQWAVKAIGGDTPQEGEEGRQVYQELDRASSLTPSTSDQQQTSGQAQKFPNGNRNPNFSRRKRGSSKGKPRFFSKSKAGSSSSSSSSQSELGHLDHEVVEPVVDDFEKGGTVSRNIASNATKPRFSAEPDVGSSSQSELLSLNETLDGEANSLSTELGNSRLLDEGEGDKQNDRSEIRGPNILAVVDPRSESREREDDVFVRLEELLSMVDEPELSKEQVRLNDQLQEDELLVMQSIYGENVFVIERHRDLRVFQIHIHVECSDELTVTAQMDSSDDPDVKSGVSSDFSYSFEVRYLPPIILTCMLPKSYPSHVPPYFVISVKWLHSTMISKLCLMLDSIWSEQKGQEVIYQWSDWLLNSSLSYLGFSKGIVLGSYSSTKVEDRRCFSGIISPVSVVPLLRSYNEEKWHENFLQSLHECVICFSEYSGNDFIILPCRHFFCCKCIQTYINIHLTEGTAARLACPEAKCGGMVPPGSFRRLLDDKDLERWESLMLQKTLESMSDVRSCPRCETPCIEDEDHDAQCYKCFFSFCTLCRERRHVGVACMTAEEKLLILQDRQSSSQIQEEQKLRERNMINDILSMREVHRNSKQCPSCNMAISRTEGCNKMVCGNCGQKFCYLCNRAINGYDHFRDGACELFPTEVIQAWERRINGPQPWEPRMNDRQVAAQAQAQMYEERGHQCPNCRQVNVKVDNNNHIFCWACQVHHCYLCKKIVRRSAEHFGPKGCKQHTVG